MELEVSFLIIRIVFLSLMFFTESILVVASFKPMPWFIVLYMHIIYIRVLLFLIDDT